MLIEYQRNILADAVRNEAFYRALQQVVRSDRVVADVGSGTGILGFIASRLGAKAVYCYECTAAIKLSQKLARQNRIARCHFQAGHSAEINDPVPVDIVVSETLGNYAYEENIIETLNDSKRFLKPGGITIPNAIRQYVCPVVDAGFYNELCSWDRIGFDLDFSPAKQVTLNNLYVRTFAPHMLLSGTASSQCWDRVDLSRANNKSLRKGSAQWRLQHAVSIYGFAVWWECDVIDGILLSTSPYTNATHWEQLYFPVLEPLVAQAGDQLQIVLHSDTRYEIGVNLKWQVSLQRGGHALYQQQLDMRKGDLR